MRWKPFATLLVLPTCLAVLSCGGGETRAEFVRKIEHHLDSNDMRTRDLDETTAVDIKAVIDGERHIVTWFVMEIDGTLRASPGQVMLASDEYPWWE